MDAQTVYYLIAGLLIAVGIAGTVLPVLPGLPLVFGGMLLAAWADGFEKIGVWTLTALGIMTLLSFVIDFVSTAMGAKRVGASPKALWGAVIGTFAGLFFGPVGLFVGPFAGALLGELWHLRKVDGDGLGRATKVGLATWVGILLGIVLKLGLAFAMLGLFFLAWFL